MSDRKWCFLWSCFNLLIFIWVGGLSLCYYLHTTLTTHCIVAVGVVFLCCEFVSVKLSVMFWSFSWLTSCFILKVTSSCDLPLPASLLAFWWFWLVPPVPDWLPRGFSPSHGCVSCVFWINSELLHSSRFVLTLVCLILCVWDFCRLTFCCLFCCFVFCASF